MKPELELESEYELKVDRVLELIAVCETADSSRHIDFGNWFNSLDEAEKNIIERYQDIRNSEQEKQFKLRHQEFLHHYTRLSGIPGFFNIPEN